MRLMFLAAVFATAALTSCDRIGPRTAAQPQRLATPSVIPERASSKPASTVQTDPVRIAAVRPARPTHGIHVAPNKYVELNLEGRSHPVRYRMGKMSVIVRSVRHPEQADEIQTEVAVEVPGLPVSIFRSNAAGYYHPLQLGWGRLDRAGTPYLLVKGFSGGVHCCTSVQAAVLRQAQIQIVSLGEWDMDVLERFPSDYDGDGNVDFLLWDNAFLYAFATHQESNMPPLILNIKGGEAEEVSERPGFRPLFAAVAREAREQCLRPGEFSPNGACAAYVASSARLGRFATAWREMLASYDPKSDWPLPKGCGLPLGRPVCTPLDRPPEHSYPKALRGFLEAAGYVPSSGKEADREHPQGQVVRR